MAIETRASPVDNETSIQSDLLVVEDDEDIGEFIAQALKHETPHAVLHVPDAFQALEAVKTITPLLFILDYQLPDSNGLDLSDRLHAIEGLTTIPTLMISANHPPRKDMQQRHITFLAKPFELHDLVQTINKLLPQ